VLDASRAVSVVGSLLSPQLRPAFLEGIRTEYDKVRAHHADQKAKALLTLAQARKQKTAIEWKAQDVATPEFLGVRVLTSDAGDDVRGLTSAKSDAEEARVSSHRLLRVGLEDLVPFIDWSPFFHTWELRGRYPAILENVEAKKLYDEAQALLQRIVSNKLLEARAVYGFFPANGVGDDVELYTDESRTHVLSRLHFLRQQMDKGAGQFNYCLADFVAPKASKLPDYIGAFAVTAGYGVEALCQEFERDHDDYNSIMTKALADRLAEAFAEYLHKRVREEWGFGKAEQLGPEDLIQEKYRGIRPAPGYPASPDHTEKWTIWKLLDVERQTGIKLTESGAMWPGASVSGLYFSHPDAKYFSVGKLDRDQVVDYQARKGMELEQVERWLGPYLNYEPGGNLKPQNSSFTETSSDKLQTQVRG
jgi:5-methyltetrahydrofolate--homocysteine methyltransferase